MDIQAIIDQIMQHVGDAPEKIGDILSDPKGAIEDITGQTLGEGDLSQIIDGVKERIAGGGIDLSKLGGLGDLLGGGENPLGNIMEGIGGLFGKK